MYIIGLGNPGIEYERTRHNAGQLFLDYLQKNNNFPNWKSDNVFKGLISKGQIKEVETILIKPTTFMNQSGQSVKSLASNMASLSVIYDDLDLPLGKFKISFNRGSGGHLGIESIAKTLKSNSFVRIRIGTSPVSFLGKIKKPKGQSQVDKFILGNFKKGELETLEKVFEEVSKAIEIIVTEGKEKAMEKFNVKK